MAKSNPEPENVEPESDLQAGIEPEGDVQAQAEADVQAQPDGEAAAELEPENDLQAEILRSVQAQMAAQQPQSKPMPRPTAACTGSAGAVDQEQDVQVFPSAPPPAVQQVQFAPITGAQEVRHSNPLDLILNVEVQATVELGRANMQVKDVLELGPGSVVELEKLAGEPVDVLVNNRPFARGEVVVIDECFGVRVTEIVNQTERIASLG